MGVYINPPDQSKEQWLLANAVETPGRRQPKSLGDVPPGHALVCLVDNGPFTAAAVIYDEGELAAFSDPDDWRPKSWFVVPVRPLCDVAPVKKYPRCAAALGVEP